MQEAPVLTASLSRWRRAMRKSHHVSRWLGVARALVHFGPWRHAARAVVRTLRPPQPASPDRAPALLPEHALPTVLHQLRTDGVSVLGTLPAAAVSRLRTVTDALPPGEYGRFHEHEGVTRSLVENGALLTILRAHFGAEPVLLECTLVVHVPRPGARIGPRSQRRLHFDFAGWQSLNLFVYLTDVHADSGAHEIAVGTHRAKRIGDVVRESFDAHEAQQRFGSVLRSITGPAGTLFLEDTEAFHRRAALTRRRVMLNVLFASHRGLLSHGRLTRSYGAYLASRAGAAGEARLTRA